MTTGQLAALVALGAFHGLNPGMGWLFAVALGFQERSRQAVLAALPAVAAGHLGSVTAAAVLIEVTGSRLTGTALAVGGGLVLVVYGLWRLLSARHFRWAGMRLSRAQLAGWSFLMSSVHGAGLMLLPVLAYDGGAGHDHTSDPAGEAAGEAAGGVATSTVGDAVGEAFVAGLVHTAAMFAVMAAVALVVYQVVGLGFLRRAWFNLDRVWAVALVAAGATTVLVG